MKRRRFIAGGLKERGWIDAETAKFESYWAGSSVMRIREIVPGLVASAPDIIIGNGHGGYRRTAQSDPNNNRGF